MKKYTIPITKANYTECWKHVWHKYGRAKRSLAIGKLVGIFGELVFLLSMLFISIGGIYSMNIGVINEFLESIPYLVPLWTQFCQAVFQPEMETPAKFAIALLSAYGVSVLFCVALAALVWILYHPFAGKLSEDIAQNAETMMQKARKAKTFSLRAKDNISTACDILYLVTLAGLLTLIILINLDRTNVIETISAIFPINNMLVVTFVVFVVFVSYSVLDNLFVFLTQWLYYCKIPHSLLADTARFRLFISEQDDGLSPEALAEKRTADAIAKREAAFELEKNGEYARAKQQFWEASLGGDHVSMDNYARHCIIANQKKEAIYWLQCCVDTGKADDVTAKRLKDLKRGRHISLRYR